ncbi:unknown protein [Seminavis robusta]|uniref:Uncharacterized protein n=1 Tax=Seminavis robusta TaxID=568900 RepID=A0A9N8DAQ2_9STRA|nr:unknown protein [Seminavis robusta]|eukprot:Sro13_g010010.1 n/a (152) ;mRNA; r:94855-95310
MVVTEPSARNALIQRTKRENLVDPVEAAVSCIAGITLTEGIALTEGTIAMKKAQISAGRVNDVPAMHAGDHSRYVNFVVMLFVPTAWTLVAGNLFLNKVAGNVDMAKLPILPVRWKRSADMVTTRTWSTYAIRQGGIYFGKIQLKIARVQP